MRLYFLAHDIIVLTDQPLNKVLTQAKGERIFFDIERADFLLNEFKYYSLEKVLRILNTNA